MIGPTTQGDASLDAVRLIDVRACAAIGSVSKSWWNQMVAEGRAPPPVVRSHRFTRWRFRDVAAFWAALADGAPDRAWKASEGGAMLSQVDGRSQHG